MALRPELAQLPNSKLMDTWYGVMTLTVPKLKCHAMHWVLRQTTCIICNAQEVMYGKSCTGSEYRK